MNSWRDIRLTTKLSDRRWAESNYDTMGRQSHNAIERIKHIASMSEADAKAYILSEKRVEPEEGSAGSSEARGSDALSEKHMTVIEAIQVVAKTSYEAGDKEQWKICCNAIAILLKAWTR